MMIPIKSKKPILVTGSHCSGTTWVGRMIAVSPCITYIHEPFHLDRGLFDYWFTYINEDNKQEHDDDISNIIEFRYPLVENLKEVRNVRGAAQSIKKYARSLQLRLLTRPLIKDPIAFFSAEWLSNDFCMDTIVMVRHPAAFAGSLKMKNWTHPFSHFLEQPALMRDHLYPFEKEIKAFAAEDRDIIDQAALLWKMIHYTVLKYKKKHPDWIFIRHEDISIDPIGGFEALFEKTGVKFTRKLVDVIAEHSGLAQSPSLPESSLFPAVRRDSRSNINSWKERLTISEVRRIKSFVKEVSEEFYSEEDW